MTRPCWILSLTVLFSSSIFAETIRFEETVRVPLPASFIYDPITETSTKNRGALASGKSRTIETGLPNKGSFTIEAFAQPKANLSVNARQILPVFALAASDTVLVAGVRRSPAPHSYHWWNVRLRKGSAPPLDLARNRYKGISMVHGETPWRHLAVTWNAETKTLSSFLDYRLQQSTVFEAPPEWDLSQLEIGRATGIDLPFAGTIDEVRVTTRALEPWHFLRATEEEWKGISFAPEESPALPDDYGHVDVRLHYGAVGDGIHDDTEAIRKAFRENENRVPNEYMTVYFPEGVYRITDSIRFSRFMVVRGAGKEKTIIQLADGAEGYENPETPKPAFAVGYDWPYENRPKKNRAGNVIGNYLFDFTIDTGSNNPAVLGLDFHCNNVGCAENIDIRSGDGLGLVGLDFKRGWPGPCLMKNMEITGFDYGIAASYREYSLVFSDIRLKNQNVAAIHNAGNILSMEKVVSENTVPALINENGGLVVLMRSALSGGSPEHTAITSENASIYLRDVEVDGYKTSILERKIPKEGDPEERTRRTDRDIDEFFTGPQDGAFEGAESGSLKLEIRDTPLIEKPPAAEWVNVRKFSDLVVDGDWAPAIEAAVAEQKAVVYFPAGEKYRIDRDVVIDGAVRTFFGGSPKTGIENGIDKKEDSSVGPALVLGENLPVFEFDLLGSAHVRHETATDLIFRHCSTGHISAGKNCGALFIEDAGGKWRFSEHQRVWGRQMNPETKGIPEIINDGGQLWVLGLKTEYLSTKIENRNGAQTEILGGLMYPVHPVTDEALPMFLNENSDISLIHAVSVYGKNHKIYMKDIQQGETRDFREWRWENGRPIANLYRSSR